MVSKLRSQVGRHCWRHRRFVFLQSLKDHTDNITVIVTVADDGGSFTKHRIS